MYTNDQAFANEIADLLTTIADSLSDESAVGMGLFYLNNVGNSTAKQLADKFKSGKEFYTNGGNHKEELSRISLKILCLTVLRGNFESVSLNNLKIDDEIALLIAAALKRNKTIKSLSLQSNQIGDAGASAIADALSENATLTKLELSGNSFNDDGLCAFARCFSVNASIESFQHSRGQVSTRSIDALLDGLRTNSSLRTVHINPEVLTVTPEETISLQEKMAALLKVNFSLSSFTVLIKPGHFLEFGTANQERLSFNNDIKHRFREAELYISNRLWGNEVYVKDVEKTALSAISIAKKLQTNMHPIAQGLAAKLNALAIKVSMEFYRKNVQWKLRIKQDKVATHWRISFMDKDGSRTKREMDSFYKFLLNIPHLLLVATNELPLSEAKKIYQLIFDDLNHCHDLSCTPNQPHAITLGKKLTQVRMELEYSLTFLEGKEKNELRKFAAEDTRTTSGKLARFNAFECHRNQSRPMRHPFWRRENLSLFNELAITLIGEDGAFINLEESKNTALGKRLLKLTKNSNSIRFMKDIDIASVVKYYLLTTLFNISFADSVFTFSDSKPMTLDSYDKSKVDVLWKELRPLFGRTKLQLSTAEQALVKACDLSNTKGLENVTASPSGFSFKY